MILDARTMQSTPESGARAGYDGHKRRKGSKVHAAVDTLGHLLALLVTPANEQERAQVAELAEAVQAVTGEHVELAYVDQGYTGQSRRPRPPRTASSWRSSSCPRPSAASCCCRGAGSWSVASPGPRAFRRLARDYERLAATLAALHFLAFVCLLLHRFTTLTLSP